MKNEIITYLKKHGESLDADIANEVGLSLQKLLPLLDDLTAKGDIMSYQSTKFINGKPMVGMRCRVSGFIPKAAPGRKSGKVQLKLT